MKRTILVILMATSLFGCATNQPKLDEFLKPLNLTTIKEEPVKPAPVQPIQTVAVTPIIKPVVQVQPTAAQPSPGATSSIPPSYDTVVRAELAKTITDKTAVIRALTKSKVMKYEDKGVTGEALGVCYGVKTKTDKGVYTKERTIFLMVKGNKVVNQMNQDTTNSDQITQICNSIKGSK